MTLKKPGDAVRRASRVSTAAAPHIKLERAAWDAGYEVVAGVDEVGRGAWAGPLVAAALILPRDSSRRARLTRRLNQRGLTPRDSKLLRHDVRRRIVDELRCLEFQFAIVEIPPSEVDRAGVGVANERALCEAIRSLGCVDYALVDAFRINGLECERKPVIGGDRVCMSIALASIVAKVHRDQLMCTLHEEWPGYGFDEHKGYGTRAHASALAQLGVSPHHRRSFRPVAERLEQA